MNRDTDHLMERALSENFGDFDSMVERGFIRIGVPYNPLFFAFDGQKSAGLSAERGKALQKYLRKKYKKTMTVIVLPKSRDEMFPALLGGKVDMLDANLTILEERLQDVEFSLPIRVGVRELVVTHSDAGEIQSFDDLVGTVLYLRKSSSYYSHLQALNAERKAASKSEIAREVTSDLLEDHDLLEMIHGGLIPATIVDSHKASLWLEIYPGLKIQNALSINDDGEIAFALRKGMPKLKAELDAFSKTVKIKSALGNILHRRYLESTK